MPTRRQHQALRPGLQVGRFRVEERLGEGSFAEVWRASHPSGTTVALKLAKRTGLPQQALKREAERLARLDHPGIVHAFDRGTVNGRAWLALELATGTLAQLPAAVPIADLAAHLLSALAHLHAHGLLHRDVKPSNILVGCPTRTGEDAADRAGVRLADFGISWAGGQDSLDSAGTPGWSSPEQSGGTAASHHPHNDIYSLARVVEAVMQGPTTGPWAAWIARATHIDPTQRFATAAHALGALPTTSVPSRTMAPPGLAETETQPVQSPIPRTEHTVPPTPVHPPPWPEGPPARPHRLPPFALLDAGSALLPHRPVPRLGRSQLLSNLWIRLRDAPTLALDGDPSDVTEVGDTLARWAREVGHTRTIEHVPGAATRVPPLTPSDVQGRVQALGFDPVHAIRIARGTGSWTDVRARLTEYVRADLVQATAHGLQLRSSPAPVSSGDLAERCRRAVWLGDAAELAEITAELEQTTAPAWPALRRQLTLQLCRSRLELHVDLDEAPTLLDAADQARTAGWSWLADALGCAAVEVHSRGRAPRQGLALLEQLPPSDHPLVRARMTLNRGYLLAYLPDRAAIPVLRQAARAHDGIFANSALATLSELHGVLGDAPEARATALAAIEASTPDIPASVVTGHLALAATYFAEDLDHAARIVDEIEPATAQVSHLMVRTRVMLVRADIASRKGRWDEAFRHLEEAQSHYLRRGKPQTVFVLNQALLCLRRGDLTPIPSLTPPDWPERTASAAPGFRVLMEFHAVLVGLAQGDDGATEQALAPLETRSDPLPAALQQPIALTIELVSEPWSTRLAALWRTHGP
ncbi:MAG: protein kinase [Myxococcales bacterium]|nr:protein kinase [Myxococcales bacterium]